MYALYSLVPTNTDCMPWGSELCSGSPVRGRRSPQKKKKKREGLSSTQQMGCYSGWGYPMLGVAARARNPVQVGLLISRGMLSLLGD